MAKKEYKKPSISREQLEAELYAANESLWQANRKLENEERARMELLSNLSHDLRSPVTALVSSVELLKSGGVTDPDAQQEILELMERRLTALQKMINDLFLLTTVESPTVELQTQAVEAGMFLEEFYYSCTADAKYAKRQLLLTVPEHFPYLIEIDADKMARVLDNLFTNALRYSNENDTICLGAAYVQKPQPSVEITVEDSGVGISAEDLPHIFERSYRASRSRTPGNGGSGLGLAIAKGIVEKHGGSIRCESTVGEGSRFAVTLPVAELHKM